MEKQLTALEAFRLIAGTTFRPFTETDWQAFQGCQTENPLVGENGEWAIVIDGEEVTFVDEDVNWFNFRLNSLD